MIYTNSTLLLLIEILSVISSAFFFLFHFCIIEIPDYANLYDTFDSSPLFNFYLGEICSSYEKKILFIHGKELKLKLEIILHFPFTSKI